MDTEKEKAPPQMSRSFASRNAREDRDDADQDQQQNNSNNGIDDSTNSEPPPETQPNSGGTGDSTASVPHAEKEPKSNENDETDDSIPSEPTTAEGEAKSENADEAAKKNEEDATNIEESPPTPDFEKICEEVDQFISALSSAKGNEESELPDVPVVMEQFTFLVEAKIANYDPSESPVKWCQLSEQDSSAFLETVDRISMLVNSLCEFSSESKYAWSINRVGGIQQRAMTYLEDEFRSLLDDFKVCDLDHNNNNEAKTRQQESDQTLSEEANNDGENNFLGYSEEVVSNLKRLANVMIKGGYEAECF